MVDIDHFKKINDTYGHGAGDEVLKRVGAAIREVLRASDTAGRFGGEEFIVVLPHTPLAGALDFAERLRMRISELVIATPADGEIRITCSVGVAEVHAGHTPQPEKVLHHADSALYEAKRSGRNRVHAAIG